MREPNTIKPNTSNPLNGVSGSLRQAQTAGGKATGQGRGYNVADKGQVDLKVSVDKKGILGKLSRSDWRSISDDVAEALARAGIKKEDILINAHPDGLDGSSQYDFLDIKAPGVSVTRSFFEDGGDLVAYHALMELDKGLQGKGVAKGIIRSLLPAYEKMGVDRIEVYASLSAGGYTWARFGFKTEHSETSQIVSTMKSKTYAKRAQAIIDNFYKTHDTHEGFPVNLIASQPWGKKALAGTDWLGYVDMHDKEQLDYMKRYASR